MSSSNGALGRVQRAIRRDGWRSLAGEMIMRPMRPALAPFAARSMRRNATRCGDIDELLDLVFGFDAFGITVAPYQSRWEFRELLLEASEVRPRAMLEIGTASGGSLLGLARVCAPDAHIISIDLPHGEFGGGYPRWKLPLYESFASSGQHLDLVRGDSHDPRTLARVSELLEDRPLDLLFIDGDHTYTGVRQDLELYEPLVCKGGLIAFHDICASNGGPHRDATGVVHDSGDVPRFWSELRAARDGREILDPSCGDHYGIGVLRV